MANPEEQETALAQALDNALELHNLKPTMYYLGEGDQDKVKECREVFRAMRPIASRLARDFFNSDEAIPVHGKFSQLKRHIDQIRGIYQAKEASLIQLFVSKLLPSNPLPLRFEILSSISMFSTRVYLHDESLRPSPLQAYVDGYFHLVVNMGENVVRIPLLGSQPDQLPKLPLSLRFTGGKSHGKEEEEEQKKVSEYLFRTAPKTGRRTQLHTFISIMNSGKPVQDFLHSFMTALVSFDMSFATAVCALASGQDALGVCQYLVNILAVNKMLDHFLRCLGAAVRQAVAGSLIEVVPELFALDNMFLSHCREWARNLAGRLAQDMSEDSSRRRVDFLLLEICRDIKENRVPQEALYILRALLVIAAYEDQTGVVPLSMFLEVVVRPFAIGFAAGQAYMGIKDQLSRGDSAVQKLRDEVEDTIVTIMGMDLSLYYYKDQIEDHLMKVYNFTLDKLNDFVQLVIMLNARKKSDHPVVQMITFSFNKCGELALF